MAESLGGSQYEDEEYGQYEGMKKEKARYLKYILKRMGINFKAYKDLSLDKKKSFHISFIA